MAVVSMKNLLESGVHFGHQTRRWNPKMMPFIFAKRNGIHIIDLQQTITCIKVAYEATRQTVIDNKSILFVGTKKQARQAIEREAKNCDMHYVNNRWLGGTLTNFETIKKSLLQLKKLEKMEIDGTFDLLSKKEVSQLNKERFRLEKNLGGIKEMKSLPGLLFVVDTNKEAIAVKEAKKMNIPVIAVVDTNCNPDNIDYPIPGNDDAIRAISLFTQIIANAAIEADNEIGLEIIENLQEEVTNEADDEQSAPNDQTDGEYSDAIEDEQHDENGNYDGDAHDDTDQSLSFQDASIFDDSSHADRQQSDTEYTDTQGDISSAAGDVNTDIDVESDRDALSHTERENSAEIAAETETVTEPPAVTAPPDDVEAEIEAPTDETAEAEAPADDAPPSDIETAPPADDALPSDIETAEAEAPADDASPSDIETEPVSSTDDASPNDSEAGTPADTDTDKSIR